ncbi:MAG: MarR family winged helix-turn-helix transcriptional regulator [Candidatus Thiodiazotropha sp.]|nr:MarR family winged helix-turn-helix transcriptional regulator [Candidatus Thiodiazotropha sp.]MCU7872875.1 MarR family winged helix-turn-helix transcriptional regulator [Candidatus Thiodiazotropha sp. (ex Lucinoma borealis)]
MKNKKSICDLEQCQEIGQTCAVFNLRKASRAITQLYEEMLRPSGILPTQFTLLVAVRGMGPIAISKLADQLVMDRTTLTRNLKPLERDGLLRVIPGMQDQRSREVKVTQKGINQLGIALPLWRDAQRKIRKALGDSRLDRMLDDLSAVVEAADIH